MQSREHRRKRVNRLGFSISLCPNCLGGCYKNLQYQGKDLEITKTIINLAKCLNLDIIAEGIETPIQKEILQSLDCEAAQGYLFSRPLNFDAVISFLST